MHPAKTITSTYTYYDFKSDNSTLEITETQKVKVKSPVKGEKLTAEKNVKLLKEAISSGKILLSNGAKKTENYWSDFEASIKKAKSTVEVIKNNFISQKFCCKLVANFLKHFCWTQTAKFFKAYNEALAKFKEAETSIPYLKVQDTHFQTQKAAELELRTGVQAKLDESEKLLNTLQTKSKESEENIKKLNEEIEKLKISNTEEKDRYDAHLKLMESQIEAGKEKLKTLEKELEAEKITNKKLLEELNAAKEKLESMPVCIINPDNVNGVINAKFQQVPADPAVKETFDKVLIPETTAEALNKAKVRQDEAARNMIQAMTGPLTPPEPKKDEVQIQISVPGEDDKFEINEDGVKIPKAPFLDLELIEKEEAAKQEALKLVQSAQKDPKLQKKLDKMQLMKFEERVPNLQNALKESMAAYRRDLRADADDNVNAEKKENDSDNEDNNDWGD